MNTKSVRDVISYDQGYELILVLKKAGFNVDLIQKIINSKSNRLAKEMYGFIASVTQASDQFELVNTFSIIVPAGYNHATRLDTFGKKHRREFSLYNSAINDENYGRGTTKLIPGERFRVKIFRIKGTVSSEDCLAFLHSQKALLVGAQGLSLVYEQDRNYISVSIQCLVSFDKKDALWQGTSGDYRVPYMWHHQDGSFEFNLGFFELQWGDNCSIICFCATE